MSDLSRLLDDLYAMSGTETDTDTVTATLPTEEPTRAPEWSSEEALDEVFSSWVPGPSDDASATERSMIAETRGEPLVEQPTVDAWLQETEPIAPLEPAVLAARWSPSDDDILPARRHAVARRGPRFRR